MKGTKIDSTLKIDSWTNGNSIVNTFKSKNLWKQSGHIRVNCKKTVFFSPFNFKTWFLMFIVFIIVVEYKIAVLCFKIQKYRYKLLKFSFQCQLSQYPALIRVWSSSKRAWKNLKKKIWNFFFEIFFEIFCIVSSPAELVSHCV